MEITWEVGGEEEIEGEEMRPFLWFWLSSLLGHALSLPFSLSVQQILILCHMFSLGTALNEYIYDLNMSSAWQMVRRAG